MTQTIVHRGPDDAGDWVDASAGYAVGFRRLAIVDLSPAGHQPMESVSGRYVIAFNGEVYNYQAVREELQAQNLAPDFRGHSDTEVLLAAVEAWGLEAAVRRFIGMFAFALWDRKERTLYLGRDRLGVKPMYYGWAGETFLFGSELKALRAHPDFRAEIDRNATALFLRHNYIPAPYTIYRKVCKLLPGSILTLPAGSREPIISPYWTMQQVAEEGNRTPFQGTEAEALDHLDALLRDAIGLRMIADVPLGVFLSGGIDSSLVVAQMQAQSARPVRTFSIGFHEDAFNEAHYAQAVAKHLGTDHTEFYVTSKEALAVIPKLPTLFDEPFADASQIPTFLVSELARRHVTVSLSGDGGDEFFGGYERYQWGREIWNRIGWMPRTLRKATASTLTALSPEAWERVAKVLGPALPEKLRKNNPGRKLVKIAEVIQNSGQEALYRALVSHWKEPHTTVLNASEPPTALTDESRWADLPDFTSRMMYLDSISYLPDDILVKVDRASMGVSLEAREPLLDHRLVEFSWRLPIGMKVREGKGKWPLRQVLDRYVPETIMERPKKGFSVPIGHWLRGPLREWAESLLEESRLQQEGFFDPRPIRKKWDEHLSGRQDWQYYIWVILMFQSWLETS